MKIFSKLFILSVVVAACSPLKGQNTGQIDLVFEPTEISKDDLIENRVLGATMNYPIVFEKEKKYHSFKVRQDDYIREHCENCKVVNDSLMINRFGRLVQGLTLEHSDDAKNLVHLYFDIDDVCRRYQKLNDDEMAQRVKKLLKSGATGKMKEIKLKKSPK